MINWLRLALSMFNTILLIWLGLTVLLNADKRRLGVWVVTLSLLLGGLFFISHTAVLVNELSVASSTTARWFFVGVTAATGLPLGWYLAVLWYAGFWDSAQSPLRQRQQGWLVVTLLIAFGGMIALAAKANRAVPPLNFIDGLMDVQIVGLPLDAWGYIAYVILCVVLSLDAVRQPAPPQRVMGDLGRERARPWLIGTSLALLGVGVGVAFAIFWIIRNTFQGGFYLLDGRAMVMIGRFDLILSILIAFAVLMLGQAIVSYELFTGKTLPRRGLRGYWRGAIGFAIVYSLLISSAVSFSFRPIYTTLLTTTLLTVTFALLAWRAFAERERYMSNLRPFVTSQRLYDTLLTDQSTTDAEHPFSALCSQILDCESADLITVGTLSPLVPNLTYPHTRTTTTAPLQNLTAVFTDPTQAFVRIDPHRYDGAQWATPLWSERGLIGILLLGGKRSGGVYTQEEIDIARTTAERLIDTQASATIANRLMQLQRERTATQMVVDQQSRRVLHDEVLPLLHTALLSLEGDPAEARERMVEAHKQVSNLLHELPMVTTPEVARLGLIAALRRMVDNEFRSAFDEVVWEVEAGVDEVMMGLGLVSAETTYFAARETLRNAAKYARHPDRPLSVRIAISQTAQTLNLTIEDNGVGINTQTGGHGLELHSTMMAVVGGSFAIETIPNQKTAILLTVPL